MCAFNLPLPPLSLQPPGAKPVVKCLLEQGEELEVNENYFTVPVSLQECVVVFIRVSVLFYLYHSPVKSLHTLYCCSICTILL